MGFIDTINADIKSAMLAKEKEKLSALRDIKSKLMLEATSGNGEVSEEVAMKIVMKLHKQRMETYDLYIKEGREDLAKDEKDQAEVIAVYLPKMLSADEVKTEVENAIAATGAAGPQDMGKVMGVASKQLAGLADGKAISVKVGELLKK